MGLGKTPWNKSRSSDPGWELPGITPKHSQQPDPAVLCGAREERAPLWGTGRSLHPERHHSARAVGGEVSSGFVRGYVGHLPTSVLSWGAGGSVHEQ